MLKETQTSICNKALLLIGEEPINSMDDTSTKQARVCREFYATSIRSVLEEGQWPFATIETPVQRINVDKYTKEQKFVYRIPEDCALIIGLTKRFDRKHMPKRIDWDIRYIPELKTSAIICDRLSFKMDDDEKRDPIYEDEQILLEYISDTESVYSYSAAFVKCAAAQLAADICMPLTHDQNRFISMVQYAEQVKQKALRQSLNEDNKDKQRWVDPLTASRGRYIC